MFPVKLPHFSFTQNLSFVYKGQEWLMSEVASVLKRQADVPGRRDRSVGPKYLDGGRLAETS